MSERKGMMLTHKITFLPNGPMGRRTGTSHLQAISYIASEVASYSTKDSLRWLKRPWERERSMC